MWCLTAIANPETPPDDAESSQVATETGTGVPGEDLTEKELQTIQTEVATNEDPEAQRRAERETEAPQAIRTFEWSLYGSVRVHAISNFDIESRNLESRLGDGASRIGVSGSWQFTEGWNLFGRLESGFDVLDTFTPKAQNDEGGALTPRLHNLGLESDSVYVKYGKSWSTYYQVAGATDRFAIFGGSAAGVYNAGTDGGATGTGRANDALQTFVYVDFSRWVGVKPFNLNVQYQKGEPIPWSDGLEYGSTFSFSAWLETKREIGVGLAWHRANIGEAERVALRDQGIDGDAQALAIAFKTYGDRWLASLVLARLENIETTDQLEYFDGTGAELFAQWQFRDRWWLVGGGNWLRPDSDSPRAGEYEVKYAVLGLRYTLDSFNRMLYAEWRNDFGSLADGTRPKNEITVGVRWDFGY